MRIVLADDDPDVCLLVRTLLERQGHVVVTAADGREAVERVRDERPDVLLVDGLMPEMDGVDVVRALRAEPGTAALPIVFLSAIQDPRLLAEVRSLGVRWLLPKPVDVPALIQTLERISGDE